MVTGGQTLTVRAAPQPATDWQTRRAGIEESEAAKEIAVAQAGSAHQAVQGFSAESHVDSAEKPLVAAIY